MKLSQYPSPKDVLKNEKETLRLLSANKDISTYYPQLCIDSQTGYQKLQNTAISRQQMLLLDFESYMDIKINLKLRRVFLGGLIKLGKANKYEEVSYYMAICKHDRPSKVMRKFHFDFESGADSLSQSFKPFFHIQYGGKMSPRMHQEGFKDERHYQHIDSWLELPRITYMPMSLIFLVFLIIKELDKEHVDILKKPEWHAQMCRSENVMLTSFYNTCNKAFSQNKSILMDCYYNARDEFGSQQGQL